MGSGNLTIAHDNVFNREVLDNKAYFFTNNNDVVDIIKTIENENNKDMISSLKEASKLRIQNYYTWENIARKYVNIFNSVIND